MIQFYYFYIYMKRNSTKIKTLLSNLCCVLSCSRYNTYFQSRNNSLVSSRIDSTFLWLFSMHRYFLLLSSAMKSITNYYFYCSAMLACCCNGWQEIPEKCAQSPANGGALPSTICWHAQWSSVAAFAADSCRSESDVPTPEMQTRNRMCQAPRRHVSSLPRL